jgi:acetolactate synthase I/II/III large subunit
LAVCGDGGFMMNSQELETAVRLGLNLVVLIVQDNAYGMIRWKQTVDKFPDWGLTFGNPDFVRYATSYGAKGSRVGTADGLVPALETAFKAGGVYLARCRWTTRKTSGCWSTSCATACRQVGFPSSCPLVLVA